MEEDYQGEIQWKKTVTRPACPLKGSEIGRGGAEVIPEKIGELK